MFYTGGYLDREGTVSFLPSDFSSRAAFTSLFRLKHLLFLWVAAFEFARAGVVLTYIHNPGSIRFVFLILRVHRKFTHRATFAFSHSLTYPFRLSVPS